MVLFFQMIIIQNKDNKTQKIEGNCDELLAKMK